MAKDRNTEQRRLKVVTSIDESPETPCVDKNNGQVRLFEVTKVLVPEGFEEFAGFFNNRLAQTDRKLEASTEQNRRLANTLETMIPKFIEQSVNHDSPDLVLGCLREGETADVAIADGTALPAELVYTLSTGVIAKKVGNQAMKPSRMANLLRDFNLFGDPKFHHRLETTENGICQKYKPSIVAEIYKRLQNPEKYGISQKVVAKYSNYIRPQEVLS